MTQPRMCVPGGTYLVTRTTVMDLYLLTPCDVVNQVMEYCLALAARGRGILIHAVSVESNHYHVVVTDLGGDLSDFVKEFNRCTSRCLLAYYRGRFPKRRMDAIWSPASSFSAQLLLTQNAILDKLLYTFTNPVKDALVPDYRKWPGFNTRPCDWTRGERTVKRPDFYFRNVPQTLTYRLECPLQLGGKLKQAIEDVEQHIRERQNAAAATLGSENRSFLGVKTVLRTSPFDSPNTPRERGTRNPHLAAGGNSKALAAATEALRLFWLAYRKALSNFRRGLEAVFPGGTLMMCKRFKMPCEPLNVYWCQLAPS